MQIFWITILTFFASIIGTITGFGISTVMVPIILFFLPLPETLLLVGLIHWFGDLWKMLLFKHGIDRKILLYFGIPGVIMASIGASLTLKLPERVGSEIVGVILISYVLYLIFKPAFKLKPRFLSAVLGGAGSGFMGGLTGVGGGALRAIVLTAFNIPKSVYIFTSGVLGALIDASRIGTYFLGGTRIEKSLMLGFLIFIPTSFLGAEVAKKIVDKIPQQKFRIIIAIFLFLLGIKLLIFP